MTRQAEQNTLIIRHYCEREYVVQGEKKSKWQFAYFHLKSTCARKKFPEFKKEQLKLSGESKAIIPAENPDGRQTQSDGGSFVL
jgi:hypothetical protein